MEWFFTLVLVLILFGPIVWVFTLGRRAGAPDQEDKFDSTTFGWLIRKITKTWRSG